MHTLPSIRPISAPLHDHVDGRHRVLAVETKGLEPSTPALQRRCATSCATSPGTRQASRAPPVAGVLRSMTAARRKLHGRPRTRLPVVHRSHSASRPTVHSPAGQSSLVATAFGVTFIFGSYSATSTTRPSRANAACSSSRTGRAGPVEALVAVATAAGTDDVHAGEPTDPRRFDRGPPSRSGTNPQARNARSDAALPGATWAQHRSPAGTRRQAGPDQPPAVAAVLCSGSCRSTDELPSADEPAPGDDEPVVVAVHLDVAPVVTGPPHPRVVVEVGPRRPAPARARPWPRARHRGCRRCRPVRPASAGPRGATRRRTRRRPDARSSAGSTSAST